MNQVDGGYVLSIDENSPYKERCSIGKYCYGIGSSPRLEFYKGPECKLEIGSFVSFATGVVIHVGGEHHSEYVSAYPFELLVYNIGIESVRTKGNIVIGSDVLIGSDTIILSGVTIGHGAIVGAGSVVAKDVAPYTIVAGNPIREVRKRFTEDQIEKLLQIRWWEWDDAILKDVIPYLMSKDIEKFIELYF